MKCRKILSLGVGLCLMLALSASASAADYTFDGVDGTDYYGATNYESAYGSAYNYGGKNAVDFAIPDLPYGVVSNTSIGAMERVRVLDSNGYASATPLTGGGYGLPTDTAGGGSILIDGIGEVYDPSASAELPAQATLTIREAEYPLVYQKTAFTSTSGMTLKDGSIGTIRIPSLKIDVKVWDGETNESMAKGLGHYVSTSAWDGNCGFCGHNRGAKYPIGAIKDLSLGDKITYTTVYGTRTYAVSYVGTIANNDWNYLQATSDNRITLTTCLANQPSYRVVVQATEVK